MNLSETVLGGLIVFVLAKIAPSVWHRLRRHNVPFLGTGGAGWTKEHEALLAKANGGALTRDDVIAIIDYERRDYLAQGSKVVTVGFLRRKMRMDRKNGYALIMTKPTQPTRKTRVHVG